MLCSVLDELRNILGDKYSETELTRSAITHNFQLEATLNALLNMSSPVPAAAAATATTTTTTTNNQSLPQREKRTRNRGATTGLRFFILCLLVPYYPFLILTIL